MKASVYIATSLDGFIARENGSLDWLPGAADATESLEDFGYKAFMDSVDALVMGRKTFEFVAGLGSWPYTKPVIVMSQSLRSLPEHLPNNVQLVNGDAKEMYQKLEQDGLKHLYIDGGQTIQAFLRAGLIDELTLTRVPILIGLGVPLFGALPHDVRLEHQETRAFDNGFVQSRYKIIW
ncbi:MAG: dihydrofolate reductase [Trueperaceae bacterium]|nr:dihydrofolate reductase [Trueperaceae bacterium]